MPSELVCFGRAFFLLSARAAGGGMGTGVTAIIRRMGSSGFAYMLVDGVG